MLNSYLSRYSMKNLMSIFQVLVFVMSRRLKLSVLFWFYCMAYKPPGLECKRDLSGKKGGSSYSGLFENEVQAYLVNRLSSMASFEITS